MLNEMGIKAKKAFYELSDVSQTDIDNALLLIAEKLIEKEDELIAANKIDVDNGINKDMKAALIDRLQLTKTRIKAMAEGLRQVAALKSPVGETVDSSLAPNGLDIIQKRVPLGVIGIIYESRPNVTVDAFCLCFKTQNAVILKGGSDSINSNIKIVKIIRETLSQCNIDPDVIQLIEDTDRETTVKFMKLKEYVDVLIPRGSAGLIKTVVENSTIPCIETGTGNCHIFVDETADIDMAKNILINAKTQRIGVCNACESMVVHEKIADIALPVLCEALAANNVEIRGDEKVCEIIPYSVPAEEDDYGKEYLDLIISIKVVKDINEAVTHINKYNTGHSESIITNDYNNALFFLDRIDAAAVYVNASTRFTDGFEFGLGAEIGISTQKLHARGPMGLKALTTTKFVIFGKGQIRD